MLQPVLNSLVDRGGILAGRLDVRAAAPGACEIARQD
jgi:hypothetical protein